MASTGTAKAKAKIKQSVADATITVNDGYPDPVDVEVCPEGTVQFINEDSRAYRVRLWTRDKTNRHADVDTLLPARSGITVMVDPEIKEGNCPYELIPTTTYAEKAVVSHAKARTALKAGKAPSPAAAPNTSATTAALTGGGSGGGTIKIGPHH